ncbi:glycoside hydrolase family 17 protein [Trichoderma barbatum]
MRSSSTLVTLATAVSAVNAAYQGFNYGSTFTNGQPKGQDDFEAEFKTAAGLEGTGGAFTGARLYTMIQGGTSNSPISAIAAAINTKTSLLFGLWASAGDAIFANELAALKGAIGLYCGKGLDGLVAGISVGSEDLYRITPTGVDSHAGPGAEPGTLVNYINQVRNAIKNTCLADVPIGHVDTWNAWVLDSNKPVIDAVDWLGMDTYPYYENTNSNGIANAKTLYEAALQKIQNAGPGKEVWVTETGWPVNGPSSGDATASTANARDYWLQVGCPNFGRVNVWWYTLQDAAPDAPSPSFGVIGNQLTEKPLFDLSCKNVDTNPGNPPPSSSATPSKTASSSTAASSTKVSTPAPESTTSSVSSTTAPEPQSTTTSDSQTTSSDSQTTDSGSQTTTTSEPQSTSSEEQTTTSEPQTTATSSSETTTSEPQSTSSTSASSSAASTTFTSIPRPGSSSSATSSVSGGPTAPGSSSSAAPSSTNGPGSSGNKLSSFGAAAAAIAVAAFAL